MIGVPSMQSQEIPPIVREDYSIIRHRVIEHIRIRDSLIRIPCLESS